MRRTLAVGTVLAALALGPGAATAAAPQKITFKGVGQVKLGKTFKSLRNAGLVGKLHKGRCDAAGSNALPFARLRSPLQGTVEFTKGRPHRVNDITVRGGAKARGVGIGDKLRDIKAKFPKRTIDRTQEDVFRAFFVFVPRADPPGAIKMMFIIDSDSRRISSIGVPFVPVCE
ncbi:MAG TPA: hypothetical protein VFM58_13350 [Solirubrobacteraceae bacterium]|jgi:hypothetical protein|nr:hypothetical protein [Solirubrobacteraceae bacterium]